jgi:hypothetical protein
MYDFQYDWTGKCFPQFSDLNALTNPLAQETKTRSRPLTVTPDRRANPSSDDVAWFRAGAASRRSGALAYGTAAQNDALESAESGILASARSKPRSGSLRAWLARSLLPVAAMGAVP